MHALSADEVNIGPQQLIDVAQRGEAAIVTVGSKPVMMVVPVLRAMAKLGE
jgi:antitoxin (DNA-binding transcriptional repressor) of toxin-antitoxin stability system